MVTFTRQANGEVIDALDINEIQIAVEGQDTALALKAGTITAYPSATAAFLPDGLGIGVGLTGRQQNMGFIFDVAFAGPGTATTVARSDHSVIARTTADRTTTATAAANVTDLSFAIGANEVWGFEFFLQNGCASLSGIKWAITVPSGATFRGVAVGMAAAVTAVTSAILSVSGALSGVAFNAVALATGWTHITGSVANGATAGTVALQFATVSSGQASTVYANSLMTAQRIA